MEDGFAAARVMVRVRRRRRAQKPGRPAVLVAHAGTDGDHEAGLALAALAMDQQAVRLPRFIQAPGLHRAREPGDIVEAYGLRISDQQIEQAARRVVPGRFLGVEQRPPIIRLERLIVEPDGIGPAGPSHPANDEHQNTDGTGNHTQRRVEIGVHQKRPNGLDNPRPGRLKRCPDPRHRFLPRRYPIRFTLSARAGALARRSSV